MRCVHLTADQLELRNVCSRCAGSRKTSEIRRACEIFRCVINNVKANLYLEILVLFFYTVASSFTATQPNTLNSLRTIGLMFSYDVTLFLVRSAVICATGSVIGTHAHAHTHTGLSVCVCACEGCNGVCNTWFCVCDVTLRTTATRRRTW